MASPQSYRFGKFELNPSSRALTKDGTPLRVGGRAFDILAVLVSRAGEVVAKDELIAAVWPNLHVEENNLRVHLTALRKALDDPERGVSSITNVPGRGYSFVTPVAQVGSPSASSSLVTARHNLPLTVGQVFGRGPAIDAILDRLTKRRVVTIVGHGGIGKTTIALQVAERLASSERMVAFADLAPLSDPSLAFGTIASSLGCPIRSHDPLEDLVGFIAERECCIVLDSCERVVDAVARQIESVLPRCQNLRFLATSRQPLRIPEEWIYRIGGLECPEGRDLSAAKAFSYPAVQLFVERAAAATGDFVLTDANAPFVIDICQRLEGIALALELAAARVGSLGIKGLAELSTDPARLLEQRRRGSVERHSSLHAAIDWSYEVLTPDEKVVFRRCSVFSGCFDLQAARAIVADDRVSPKMIDDAICELVEKSFLFADITGDTIQYRALDSTRFYAQAILRQEGEQETVERRHAAYFRDFFEQAERDWEVEPNKLWLGRMAAQIVNLHQALDWCYSSGGDLEIGCALTVAAVPLWLSLSLIDECLRWVRQALDALERQVSLQEPDRRLQMQLHAALGWPQMVGAANGGGTPSWRLTLGIAESLGDLDYQLRALWALWVDAKNTGLPRDGLALAERFTEVATGSDEYGDRLIGRRLRGASLHLLGRHVEAREAIEGMLSEYRAPAIRSHAVRFQFDQEILAYNTRARILWIQGFTHQALDEIRSNVQRAADLDHRLSLSSALAESACPVAFLEGDLDLCEEMVSRLVSETGAQALDVWSTYGDAFAGDLLIRKGDPGSGVTLLRTTTDKLRRTNFVFHLTAFLGALATGLSALKQPYQALAFVEEGLARCAESGEAWYLPELYRLKGQMMLELGDKAGITFLEHAIAVARKQGARAWTLRASVCLARHWQSSERHAEAVRLLRPFVGGFPGPSRDLAIALALLTSLENN